MCKADVQRETIRVKEELVKRRLVSLNGVKHAAQETVDKITDTYSRCPRNCNSQNLKQAFETGQMGDAVIVK